MIKQEVFQKTEGILYRYYKDKRDINMMHQKILILENKKNKLEHILKTTDIPMLLGVDKKFYKENITYSDIQGISYDGVKIQSSGSKESHFEKDLMRIIEDVEKNFSDTRRKIIKLQLKLTEKEANINEIEYVLKHLNEEARMFIDLKYGEKASFYDIATSLHISKSTAERRRGEIIENIAKFYNFYGTKMGRSWDDIA